ncbi:helix-turn-helix domain-containing protein (plasmid) [Escherichia coli]|nr:MULTISPECIES: helix-turn-helix domain-containing protein [Enterobacterales]MDM5002623.1 helix-turn-helix domain-containing protein [Escherichia coli]MDM5008542.1 helix-turn-helix domain-containing protein [Escherichia coli]MDM5030556.1 helix-turn-helix domain-containing protein [Escherichia coli]WEG98195.1 hypothetical protein DDCCFECM_00054 [Escherichia coli]WHF91327.1 helix-turn-helix domain-containing protein [Escherichia coli]
MNRFLTLLAIEGYTQREIARKMHCSQNTIFKRLIKIKYFSKMVVKKIFSLPTHCLRIGNINRYSIVVEPEMLARYGAYFSAKDPSKP